LSSSVNYPFHREREILIVATSIEHAISSPSSSSLVRTPPTKLFYTLHRSPRYIKEPAPTYWQHLTLDSYYIYEKIYDDCKNPDGKVSCT